MAATTIFFNGRLISVPGSYSEVDASGLEQIGLGANGIVALIGDGEGGIPVDSINSIDDFIRLTRPEQVRQTFRSGPLREAGAMSFEPSNDQDVQGGAQVLYCMKTNPATQSSATFANTFGDAATVTSEDYGAFTEQISVESQNGTTDGKLITVTFEDITETLDNVGGDTMFTLQYTEPSGADTKPGYDTMVGQVEAGGIRANGTRAEAGLDGDILAVGTTAGGSVVSSAAGDTTQQVTVYGLVGATPTAETVTLNGTTPVPLVNSFDIAGIFATEMDSDAVGTVTVRDGTPTTILSMAPAVRASGGVQSSAMFVDGEEMHMIFSAAGTENVWLVGRNTSGAVTIDRFAGTGTNATRSVVTNWAQIDFIVMSEVPAATTVTFNATAVRTRNTVQNTLLKARDYFNARQVANVATPTSPFGFTFELLTGLTSFEVANLDLTTAVTDIDNPATASFTADLFFWIDFFNTNSSLVDATRIAFTPQIDRLTITPAVATFTWEINGTTLSYTSASGTLADIQAGIIAETEDTFGTSPSNLVNTRVSAAASTTGVDFTALTPLGFTLTESDANLATSSVQVQSGSGNVPSNTTQPVFLSGGSEGTTTFSQFQTALDLLKQVGVSTIVPLTADPAVHAAVSAHCAFMGGVGRNERDAIVGGQNASLTGLPTKAEIKTQIQDLNTRHLRFCAQSIDRFNTAGERTTFTSYYQAVIGAGMQAGSTVGTSLTYKQANVLAFNQDNSWNPIDDAEELIQAGLFFMENVDGVGRRWVRNITTHLSSNNIAFTEASVNEAVNFSVFNFRTNMEAAVGKKGFSGTINAAKAIAINTLGLLVDQEILVDFRSLDLDLIVDVLEVSVEIAPIIPVNFVKNTLHLVTIRQAA